jgi:hypothetical protein
MGGRVTACNSDLVNTERLDEFLFGAQRVSPQRVRGPLAEAQGQDCFYGDGRLGALCAIDHFLPWSRHPDNAIDNLVAAHPRCNNAKSASLASVEHLRHWRVTGGVRRCLAAAVRARGFLMGSPTAAAGRAAGDAGKGEGDGTKAADQLCAARGDG